MRIAPHVWTCLTLLLTSPLLQSCLEADDDAKPAPQSAEAQPNPIGNQAGITAPVDIKTVNLDLNVMLNARAAGTPAPLVEPADVRTVLKSCVGCHNTRAASSGLALDSFPYTSKSGTLKGLDLLAITQGMVARMSSAAAPMPPRSDPSKNTVNIEIMSRFAEALAARDTEAPPAPVKSVTFAVYRADDTQFTSPLQLSGDVYKLEKEILLTLGQSYLFDLKVLGEDDQILFEVKKGKLEVPADGRLSLMYEI